MAPIRVVMVGLPPLQADLVQRILRDVPDIALVAVVVTARAMTGVLRHRSADVLIVWAKAPELVVAAVDTLSLFPHLRVVLLAGEGDTLVEARACVSYVSWPQGLVDAVHRG
jgi:hypothetical protein